MLFTFWILNTKYLLYPFIVYVGLSTHETRMAKLREQIAELEEENVREKDWVLQGEVTSKSRPKNALLEEDLEFENVTKVVPVITDEVVQGLEERIKARILENRFDDVVRKREVDEKPYLPSRMFELQDTKSKESLAQVYENEYMAAQTGKGLDDRDGKLQKECEELEKLWESICYKLDALSNAHFTPKQVCCIGINRVTKLKLNTCCRIAKGNYILCIKCLCTVSRVRFAYCKGHFDNSCTGRSLYSQRV